MTITPRPMGERSFGRWNWLGLRTLVQREVARFSSIWLQTVAAPVVTAGIFMMVFTLAFTARNGGDAGAFSRFIAPGLLMMTVIQNAFANTSSSLLVAKVQGNIVDTLMPPLSAAELTIGYVAGGVVRGLMVGIVVALTVFPLVGISVASPLLALAFLVAGSVLMALLGLIAAILAQKFDQLAAITNFVVTPLSFLSGTFYSITVLPPGLEAISRVNPFFYAIDGVRTGVLGTGDAPPALGLLVLTAFNAGLFWLAWRWFKTGYRLKA